MTSRTPSDALPEFSAEVASLTQARMRRLEGEVERLTLERAALIAEARINAELWSRLCDVLEHLVLADSAVVCIERLERALRCDFELDAVCLWLRKPLQGAEPPAFVRVREGGDELLPKLPHVGRLPESKLALWFVDASAELRSVALVGYGRAARAGVLALGAREEDRFPPGLDASLLERASALAGEIMLTLERRQP